MHSLLLQMTIMADTATPVLHTTSTGREMALRQGEDGLCLYRHVLKTRTQTRLVPAAC